MRDKMINKYIAKNHAGSVFTDSELKVIKEGNIDDMVKIGRARLNSSHSV